jgi:hypothetical protein
MMGVSFCRGENGMAHQFLNGMGITPSWGQARGEGVTQIVKPEMLRS